MIKKIFILAICLFFSTLYSFATDYKLSENYKDEIKHSISYNLPVYKDKIKNKSFIAEKLYESFLVDKLKSKHRNLYIEAIEDCQSEIRTLVFNSYMELINITEKYEKIVNKIPPTDNINELDEVLYPYLKANHINMKNLQDINNYANQEDKKLDIYIKNIYKH